MADPKVIRIPGPGVSIPRILFCGGNDWGNLCNRIARGINELAGVTGDDRVARVWTEHKHPFGYEEDLVGSDGAEKAREFVKSADWIVTIGDGDYTVFAAMLVLLRFWDTPIATRPCLAATHAGSAFRLNPSRYNTYDQELKPLIRFIGADSLHLADSSSLIAPYWSTSDRIVIAEDPSGIDIENEPMIVAHSPTNRANKGTEAIIKAIQNVVDDSYYKDVCKMDLIEGVSYQEAIARRGKAHVFVDQLNPEIGGFGCSAIEAMAQGCVVIADVRNTPADWEVWNGYHVEPPPIIHVESADEIEENLYDLMERPWRLNACRCASLDWAREWASPTAVGRYFVQKLNMARDRRVWECPGCEAKRAGAVPAGWIQWPVPRGQLLVVCDAKCGVEAERKALLRLRATFETTEAAQIASRL